MKLVIRETIEFQSKLTSCRPVIETQIIIGRKKKDSAIDRKLFVFFLFSNVIIHFSKKKKKGKKGKKLFAVIDKRF